MSAFVYCLVEICEHQVAPLPRSPFKAPIRSLELPNCSREKPAPRENDPKNIAELAAIEEGGERKPQTFVCASSCAWDLPVILEASGPG